MPDMRQRSYSARAGPISRRQTRYSSVRINTQAPENYNQRTRRMHAVTQNLNLNSRLANTLDEESTRDNQVLACNFNIYRF